MGKKNGKTKTPIYGTHIAGRQAGRQANQPTVLELTIPCS
jgi:hypothetical protein